MGTSVNVGSFLLWVRLWGEDSGGGRGGSSAGAMGSSWPIGPMPAASRDPLSLAGKPCKGSCCLQNRTRTPRACASLCPVAGRSRTPCAWAPSSPRQASCERAPFPPREPQRGPRDASGRGGESGKQRHPLARTLVLSLPPPRSTCSVSAL